MAPFVELVILLLFCALAWGWAGVLICAGICALYFGLQWVFSRNS